LRNRVQSKVTNCSFLDDLFLLFPCCYQIVGQPSIGPENWAHPEQHRFN
jgi:hypothetical protein